MLRRDEDSISRDAREGPAAPSPPARQAVGRVGAARGLRLGDTWRRAFRNGRGAFVARLGLDAAVFTAITCAIVFAVWTQDPDVRAGAAPAARVPIPAWYASARGADRRAVPTPGWHVARRGTRTVAVTKSG